MGGVDASWSHQTLGPEKGLLAPEIHTLCIFESIRFLPLGNLPPLSPQDPRSHTVWVGGSFRWGIHLWASRSSSC